MAERTEPSRALRAARYLDRLSDRPVFLPAVSVFPFLDYALPFLPNQLLLILLSALRPARWIAIALVFTAATVCGAMVTAWLIQSVASPMLSSLFGTSEGSGASDTFAQAKSYIEEYGLWALTVLALLPAPPRTAVIVCATLGLPPLQIGAAVGAGRIFSAGGVAYLAARAPGWLRRFKKVDQALSALEEHRVSGRRKEPA